MYIIIYIFFIYSIYQRWLAIRELHNIMKKMQEPRAGFEGQFKNFKLGT